uniref:Uncharacterized protein n=1 Tax=Anguilla anguilla TaxID=7936 RepID=A0A0E9UBN9_ANGAN
MSRYRGWGCYSTSVTGDRAL